MFDDESCLHLNGNANKHNAVYWADQNHPVAVEDHHQTDPRLNVWISLQSNILCDPVFLNDRLTAEQYEYHPKVTLLTYLDHLHLKNIQTVRQLLVEVLSGCWIGRRPPVEQPPISPDATSLNYFL